MRKLLLILISFTSVGLPQVAPSYRPYSLIHNEIELPHTQLSVDDEEIHIDFTENASLTIRPDGVIYILTIQLDEIKSGHLSITDWHVPDHALLFIFNDRESYTGPYLSINGEEFFSGRFITNRLTLEYFEPVNADFSGNFNVNRILPDYTMPNSLESEINTVVTKHNRERPKIMVTGYWPPANSDRNMPALVLSR